MRSIRDIDCGSARSEGNAVALAARFSHVTKNDRRVLAHAALIGYRFDPATLALTLDCDVDSLVGTLQRARDCELVVEEAATTERFRFYHALVRAALVDELTPGVARRLHRKIVRALEKRPDIDRHVDELAYHAREGRLSVETFTYSERAGDAAVVACALTDAVRYYDWALAAAAGPTSRARLLYKRSSIVDAVETLSALPSRTQRRKR